MRISGHKLEMKFLYLLIICIFIACNSCAMQLGNEKCPNTNDINDLDCYKTTIIKVFADNTFSENQKYALANTFNQWSIKTEGKVQFILRFVPTDILKTDAHIENTYFVFNKAPANSKYAGYTTWQRGAFIEIAPGLSLVGFTAVSLHEIGHALGLQHYTGNNKSIMNSTLSNGWEISCQDIRDFCNKWDCNINCQVELN